MIIQHLNKILISLLALILTNSGAYWLGNYRGHKAEKNSIEAKNNILTIKQLNQMNSDLIIQNSINESSITALNKQLINTRESYENAQIEIANNKVQLDNSNVITQQWMRLALNVPRTSQMPTLSVTTSTANAKDGITELVSASAAASGINQFVYACQQLKIKDDALIDNINATSINYNKNVE